MINLCENVRKGNLWCPRGFQCQFGQQGTPTSVQPGGQTKIYKTTKTQNAKKHLIFFSFWQHMFPNLDLALLMATVNVLSCLPRNWCIRILRVNDIVKIEL